MSTKKIHTQTDINNVIHLYINENLSTLKIAELYDVSKPTINSLLKDNNISLRKSGRYNTGFDKKLYDRTYHHVNKESKSEYHENWRKDNLVKLKEYHTEWRKNNREHVNKKSAKWDKNRCATDPDYKFKKYLRTAIWQSFKDNHSENVTNMLKHLPYTLTDLKEHITNLFTDSMSWENYGEWHLDHKIPQSNFKFTSFEDNDFKECWSLTNLQPLWATTREINGVIYIGNLNKNNRIY